MIIIDLFLLPSPLAFLDNLPFLLFGGLGLGLVGGGGSWLVAAVDVDVDDVVVAAAAVADAIVVAESAADVLIPLEAAAAAADAAASASELYSQPPLVLSRLLELSSREVLDPPLVHQDKEDEQLEVAISQHLQ